MAGILDYFSQMGDLSAAELEALNASAQSIKPTSDQLGYFGASMAPMFATLDAQGLAGRMPAANETLQQGLLADGTSMAENFEQGNYLDSGLQGLGLLGDAAYAIPVAGVGIAGALKAPRAIQQAAKLRAFHGSPYQFDEFSDKAIGSGEGAQAYGYGHYLAEREGTAQAYKQSVSEANTVFSHPEQEFTEFGGARNFLEQELKKKGFSDDASQEAADVVGLGLLEGGDLTDFEKFLQKNSPSSLADTSQSTYDAYLAGIDLAKPIKVERSKGYMYEVLVDADDSDLLDFDAPVNQQAKIMKAFRDQVIDMEADAPGEMRGMDLLRDLGGGELGNRGQYSSPEAAKRLQAAGFKGIKYADAQTRFSKGEKTKNYVIFDPRLIEISKRYGVPITVAATMLAQMDEQQSKGLLN